MQPQVEPYSRSLFTQEYECGSFHTFCYVYLRKQCPIHNSKIFQIMHDLSSKYWNIPQLFLGLDSWTIQNILFWKMTAAAHGVLHLRWPWQVIVCLEKAWTLVRLCNVTTGEGLKGTSNNINHVQAVACDFSAWILNFFNFWVQWFWQKTLPSLIQAWCVIPAPKRPFRKRLHQNFHVPWSLVGSDTVQLCTTMYNYVQLRMCASLTSHVGCHTPFNFLSVFFIIQIF